MKLKNSYLILIVSIIIISCAKEISTKDYMIASWQTTYLKIEMRTAHKSDSLEVYEDKFENNTELIAQSKYNADGTFSAWFLNEQKEKIAKSTGIWSVIDDSLFVGFTYKGRDMKVSYHITKTKEGFLARSMYDWDEDGDFDDILTMKTKRIKK